MCIRDSYDERFEGYISTPAIIGRDGVTAEFDLQLTDEEKVLLQKSANAIAEKTAAYL